MSDVALSAQSIAAEFRTRLAASLEMLCGERVDVEEAPAPSTEDLVWRQFKLSTEPVSSLYTAAPDVIGRAIGARVLSAAGLDDFNDDDVQGSYWEVLQSAVSAVAQFVGRALSIDIAVTEGCESAPESPPPFEMAYRLRFGEQVMAPLYLGLSSALLESLQPTPNAEELAKPKNHLTGATNGVTTESKRDGPAEADSGNDLGRILDLELPVRVSFGKAHLALKDVLKLTTGSIVELDRSIHDPVEIIVNDRLVGRGEVVVVEGNYGVRIQEIVSLGPG